MPTIASAILPGAIADFRERHPNIVIELVDVDSGRTLELMRYGAADLGIVSDESNGKNIEFTPLFWDECFFVIWCDHPLARKKTVTLAQITGCPLLLSPKGSRFRDIVESCFTEHGLMPLPAQEGWHMQTLAALVCAAGRRRM